MNNNNTVQHVLRSTTLCVCSNNLSSFRKAWNNCGRASSGSQSPLQLWSSGMLLNAHRLEYSADQENFATLEPLSFPTQCLGISELSLTYLMYPLCSVYTYHCPLIPVSQDTRNIPDISHVHTVQCKYVPLSSHLSVLIIPDISHCLLYHLVIPQLEPKHL